MQGPQLKPQRKRAAGECERVREWAKRTLVSMRDWSIFFREAKGTAAKQHRHQKGCMQIGRASAYAASEFPCSAGVFV
jgi:hypothetical protein